MRIIGFGWCFGPSLLQIHAEISFSLILGCGNRVETPRRLRNFDSEIHNEK